MKKLLWIGLPVLVVTFVAVRAFTQPDPPKPRERAMDQMFAFNSDGFRIGVVLSNINRHLREDLKIDSGILVEEVLDDSPAQKAGLQNGDIIVKIDGKPVMEEKDIRQVLRDMEEAKTLNFEVVRDGKTMNLQILPEKRSTNMKWFGFSGPYVGVELQGLNADLAPYFDVEPDAGVLVARVVPNSPADKAGMKSGDIITSFDGEAISDQDDLRKKLNDVEAEKDVPVSVIRKGKQLNLTVRPEMSSMRGFNHLRNIPEIADIPDLPEMPEMKHTMRDLEREMEELRNELKRLKTEDLEAIREQVQKEVEEVRKQLKELRDSD